MVTPVGVFLSLGAKELSGPLTYIEFTAEHRCRCRLQVQTAYMGLLRGIERRTVAAQILLLQLLVVLIVVATALVLAVTDANRDERRATERTVLMVATSVADAPVIAAALATGDPAAILQPYAEQVRRDTGIDFVVIMSVTGVRYSHPDPRQIGGQFRGSIAEAARGETHVEQYTGTLGPSVRAVVPVNDGAKITALVSVGVTTATVRRAVLADLPVIILAGLGALAVGWVGAWLIGRRLDRQTQGLEPSELTQMADFYDATLHSVREGVVLLDPAGTVRLANDEARRLLELGDAPVGHRLDDLGLPSVFVTQVQGAGTVRDEIFLIGERVLVVNCSPAERKGRVLGSVLTLRDRTDLQEVTGELASARSLADSLRSQNHESSNRLHTVVSLVELGRGDEAVEFATRELELTQLLTDQVFSVVDDPVLVAVLLGKSAEADERGASLSITSESAVRDHGFDPHDLVTIIGNLIDNAVDAAASVPDVGAVRAVEVLVDIAGPRLRICVGDSGPGLSQGEHDLVFQRGWSTKSADAVSGGRGIGLALVAATVRRLGGAVDLGQSPLGGAEFDVHIEPRTLDLPESDQLESDQAEVDRR